MGPPLRQQARQEPLPGQTEIYQASPDIAQAVRRPEGRWAWEGSLPNRESRLRRKSPEEKQKVSGGISFGSVFIIGDS